MLIADHVYYVTGGSSGLGLATVYRLVELGAYVAILDLNVEAGERIAKELAPKAIFIECNVTSEEDMDAAIIEADKMFSNKVTGGVVHAGGIGMAGLTVSSSGEPFSLDAFRSTVDVNLVGSFNVASQSLILATVSEYPPLTTHYCPSTTHRDDLPASTDAASPPTGRVAAKIVRSNPKPSREHPIEADKGVIILVSSVSYEEGQQGQAAYGSSKAGVVGLVLPMARDLARYGIRVVAIAPSLFDTAMGKNTSEKVKTGLLASTLFPPRFGRAEEFAHAAVAIIENQMLNGSVIRLDGGSRMSRM